MLLMYLYESLRLWATELWPTYGSVNSQTWLSMITSCDYESVAWVQVLSGCQYSVRLDHSPEPSSITSVPEQLNMKVVTGACKIMDGCSLERCLATLSVASSGICHRNEINSIAWLFCDGLAMRKYPSHYVTLYSGSDQITEYINV